jgi:PAS domain S-box-containing protein
VAQENAGAAPRPARRWRFGIRTKLVVAVGAVAAMMLVAAGLTWAGYSDIERLLAGMTRTNLPSVTHALKLSEATARLAAAAPALDSSPSQFQRQNNFVALQQQIGHLLDLIDGLSEAAADRGRVEELRSLVAAFADNLIDRNVQVDRRLQLAERARAQAAAVIQLDHDLRGAFDPPGGPPAPAVMLAATLLREATAAADLDKLADLRAAYAVEARRLVLLSERGAGADGGLARRAIALGSGAGNVFELRMLQMQTDARLAAAADEGRDLVARTAATVGRLVSAAEAVAADDERRAEAAVANGRRTLLVVGVLTLFGPLLFVWFYLGRNLVGRLSGLAEAMHRIVEGDFHAPIPRGGKDEIADMAAELGVFRDAMARLRESSQALVESETRLRRILDTSPLALAIWRVRDSRLVQVNPRWTELYRVPDEQAIGLDVGAFYADPADRLRLVEMVLKAGYVTAFECRLRRSDGHQFWAILSAARIEMDGEAAAIVSSLDITRHKQEEAALAEAKRMAEEANQAKSLFLATMSHEIRTPMNGVLTMAHLLQDMPLPSEPREMARVISDSAAALLTILDDVLDFSKIEAGRLPLELTDLAPLDLIEDVAELLAPRAREKGIGLITYVDPALPARGRGDPLRLRQIITNLAGNAIKFTQSGYVRIAATTGDPRVRPLRLTVAVSDTGIGLDAEQQARLFEPFMQADASISRRYGGTGLGLSICRRLVEMMRGEIGVESQPGRGATFHFTVPLPVEEPTPEPGPDLSGVAVLVLAEGPVAAEGLRLYLGALGAQVAVVVSDEGALAAVRAAALAGWSYEVLLLDGGEDPRQRFGLAQELMRRAEGVGGTRVVVVTSSAGLALAAAEAEAAGLFALLPKPVRRRALWRTVAAAAGRVELESDPLAPGMAEPVLAAWSPPSPAEAEAAGALVLVAEDNPTNRVVIRHLMERLGYAIELVGNGAEAWERLQVGRHGLLLTDCHMPEMDGYELTQRIRAGEAAAGAGDGPALPIIALTADALSDTARRCRECGMDDFIAKPIDIARLDAALRRWLPAATPLRRRRPPPPQISPLTLAAVDPVPQVLDPGPMLALFGGIGAEAREMLELFLDSTRPLLSELERALGAGEAGAAREAAHSVKGAAYSAGAMRLGRLCAAIETACAEEDSAVAAILPAVRIAFAEIERAVAAIDAAER